MASAISNTSSSNLWSTLRTSAQAANKQRPDLSRARSTTSEQVNAEIKKSSGVDIDAAARTVDSDGDGRFTTAELAHAEAKNLAKVAANFDANGDSKVTKAEVTSSLDKANKDRDTDGDGQASKAENAAFAAKVAEQLDSQYTGMRLKGFSREEVNSQISTINMVGRTASVVHGEGVYEYKTADKDGDGRLNATEASNAIADKSGLSDDVNRVKEYEKAESEKKAEREDQAEEKNQANTSQEQSDVTVARQMVVAEAYHSVYAGGRNGQLSVSA